MTKKPRSRGAAPRSAPQRSYRYYELLMAGFVTVFICSNLLGPAKAVQMQLPLAGTVTFGAAVLFFPLTYIFGDILTEVYGYAKARRVIWAGFGAMSFAALMAWAVLQLPPAPDWPHQQAYQVAFGNTWRIVLGSLVAYFCGEFANSFVLARMKLMTEGRHLWARTIGSTIVGEGIDSALFYPLAFWNSGIIPNELVPQLMLSQWIAKTLVEVVFTPVTYKVIGFLKRAEQEDWYDRETDFSPFRL